MKKLLIIGAGLIGNKRAKAAHEGGLFSIAGVCDIRREAAQALAIQYGARIFTDWKKAIMESDADVVLIATTHDLLAPIALAAVKAGKHVFIEKPGARRPGELIPVLKEAKKRKSGVWVGFNHRYHPAVQKMRELLAEKKIGKLMYVRGVYGHGGRKGYDKEWRAKPKVSGGGELLDQGSHLIDLTHYLVGKPKLVHAELKKYFWKMPVEDNAFLTLRCPKGETAFLHASWTQWKNRFSYEVFGATGALVISGLGGSYGVESLTLYERPPEGGAPKETVWEFPGQDESFGIELREFMKALESPKRKTKSLEETIVNLEVVEAAYRSQQ